MMGQSSEQKEKAEILRRRAGKKGAWIEWRPARGGGFYWYLRWREGKVKKSVYLGKY